MPGECVILPDERIVLREDGAVLPWWVANSNTNRTIPGIIRFISVDELMD